MSADRAAERSLELDRSHDWIEQSGGFFECVKCGAARDTDGVLYTTDVHATIYAPTDQKRKAERARTHCAGMSKAISDSLQKS